MLGHTIGSVIGVGYVNCTDGMVTRDWVNSGVNEIEVATKRYLARASLRPFYDPKSLRPKS